ncbi:MAG: hypothetical protein H6706_01240 [Myxococcales bacterium]|nr:hypothetical protein [Myxococcales bacterium]
MASARETRTRLLLLLGIAVVGVATLVVQRRLAERKAQEGVEAADSPAARARAALARADQAAINRDVDALRVALDQARDALDEALVAQPTDEKLLRSRLVLTRRLANAAVEQGQAAQAVTLLEEALSRAQVLYDQDRLAERARTDLLNVARELADARGKAGDAAGAARAATEAAQAVEAGLAALPAGASVLGDLADLWLEGAAAQVKAGDKAGAIATLGRAAARAEDATRGGDDPIAALGRAYAQVARAAGMADDLKAPEAAELARTCLRLLEERKALTPGNASLDRGLAAWNGRLGEYAEAAKDLPGAQAAYEKALAIRRALLEADPADRDARKEVVRALNRLGAFHSTAGADRLALTRYAEAAEAAAPLGDDRTRLIALGNHAHLLGRLDEMVPAKTAAAEAYALALRLVAAPGADAEATRDAASAGLRHARLLRAKPKPDKAAALAVAQAELARLGDQAGAKAVRAALEELVKELGG